MSTRLAIVLDAPPNPAEPWAAEVFARAGFHPVSNDDIAQALAKDEAARKVLLEGRHPVLEAEAHAAFYEAALVKLYGAEARLGLYGTAWLVYHQPVAACVVDWSPLEVVARRRGPEDAANVEDFRRSSHQFVEARLAKYVPGRSLTLPMGLSQAQKVEATLDYLRGLKLVP